MSYLYNFPFDIMTSPATITSATDASVTNIISEFSSDVRGAVRLADWDDIVAQTSSSGNTFYDILELTSGVNVTSSCSTVSFNSTSARPFIKPLFGKPYII